jgi:hypothetical protein
MAYATLDQILKKDDEALASVLQGEYETRKLGLLPYSGVNNYEYQQSKKDCVTMKQGTDGPDVDIDDDKLMRLLVIQAVDKDKRSDFTFLNSDLLKKLGVISAVEAVNKLLDPGEIYQMAVDIQNLSGFGKKAEKKLEESVKNS